MCRHNTGSWISIHHDILQHLTLCRHIQRRSCFIQQQDRGLPKQCPGNGQTLCLSFREAASAFFYNTVDSIRKLLYKFPCTGKFQCLYDLAIGSFRFYIPQILCNRTREHRIALWHIGEQASGRRRHLHFLIPVLSHTDPCFSFLRTKQ